MVLPVHRPLRACLWRVRKSRWQKYQVFSSPRRHRWSNLVKLPRKWHECQTQTYVHLGTLSALIVLQSSYTEALSSQEQASYTLQGILPNSSMPPGLSMNGMRETVNATVKPDNTTIRTILQRPTAPPQGEDHANLSVNNGNGIIGAAPLSPGVSTNGHDDRASQQSGQQPPKFAATLSDLMSSFRAVGLKGVQKDSVAVLY